MLNPPFSFGIAARLYAAVAALLLALAGVATYSYVQLKAISTATSNTGNIRVPQLERMAALELHVTRTSLQVRHAILSRTPEELAATLADIGHKRKAIDSLLAEYDKAITTTRGRELFDKLPRAMENFWTVGVVNLDLIQAGQKAEAFAFLVDKTIPARNEVLTSAAAMVRYQQDTLHQELEGIEGQAASTLAVLVALVLAAMVGLALFAWHITSLLRRRVGQAQAVAMQVRDGDLTQPVHDTSRDEFSPLLAALQEMQASLSRVVGKVRTGADGVAVASLQISSGNHDLSQRTEQQASALQQTAASMEQLGSTVRQNADNAGQANQLALDSSTVAQAGGAVVGQVVETMKGINDSSSRIADIIGVIDGIAFQTNILALNAAVEAARAGEQGRGFAVVAGEVRNLAQRSAEAAREIKTLINASVEQVKQGNALADKAGTTMQEVVASIRRVADIVSEISLASREQSTGVAQVGQAVTQMDLTTQKNATLVEQSTAASESLKLQAQQLVQAVAVFKLARGDTHTARA
ncbi:methyl-accepting chemotaxis protein [Sphaerotilus sp.]|uniref:methyl-accepting chemotaxis protein n=1 Tax=Sphaerotilus sp. TaxID=2093942 RepID=UPI002ACD92AE|nr:methyl-accepting chemotaxis protein [Sphaerotilus sp.]MDZ7857801.1 methyl-accepting chemotaxis protein [Sphaerotilus sp.]